MVSDQQCGRSAGRTQLQANVVNAYSFDTEFAKKSSNAKPDIGSDRLVPEVDSEERESRLQSRLQFIERASICDDRPDLPHSQ